MYFWQTKYLFVRVLVFLLVLQPVIGNDALFFIVHDPTTGLRMCAVGPPDQLTSARDGVQCAVQCEQQDPRCTGFNFYKGSQLCESYWGTFSPILTTGNKLCFHYRKSGVSVSMYELFWRLTVRVCLQIGHMHFIGSLGFDGKFWIGLGEG